MDIRRSSPIAVSALILALAAASAETDLPALSPAARKARAEAYGRAFDLMFTNGLPDIAGARYVQIRPLTRHDFGGVMPLKAWVLPTKAPHELVLIPPDALEAKSACDFDAVVRAWAPGDPSPSRFLLSDCRHAYGWDKKHYRIVRHVDTDPTPDAQALLFELTELEKPTDGEEVSFLPYIVAAARYYRAGCTNEAVGMMDALRRRPNFGGLIAELGKELLGRKPSSVQFALARSYVSSRNEKSAGFARRYLAAKKPASLRTGKLPPRHDDRVSRYASLERDFEMATNSIPEIVGRLSSVETTHNHRLWWCVRSRCDPELRTTATLQVAVARTNVAGRVAALWRLGGPACWGHEEIELPSPPSRHHDPLWRKLLQDTRPSAKDETVTVADIAARTMEALYGDSRGNYWLTSRNREICRTVMQRASARLKGVPATQLPPLPNSMTVKPERRRRLVAEITNTSSNGVARSLAALSLAEMTALMEETLCNNDLTRKLLPVVDRVTEVSIDTSNTNAAAQLRSLEGSAITPALVESLVDLCKSVAKQGDKLIVVLSSRAEFKGMRLAAIEPKNMAQVTEWITCSRYAERVDTRAYVSLLGIEDDWGNAYHWRIGDEPEEDNGADAFGIRIREQDAATPLKDQLGEHFVDPHRFLTLDDVFGRPSVADRRTRLILAAFPESPPLNDKKFQKSPTFPYFYTEPEVKGTGADPAP